MTTGRKILVVDDEIEIGEFIAAAAENLGLECIFTTDAIAMEQLLTPDVGLIVLDLMMPEMDGVELLRSLSHRHCKTGIVLMSGVGMRVLETAGQLAEAHGLTIVGYLQKPFRLADLEVLLVAHAERAATPKVRLRRVEKIEDSELRRAIERDEFVVHYQPQVEISTGQVTGLEALVRWQHPVHGLVFPDSFVGLAEALGLVDRLGWIVAARGMSELRQFADGDGKMPSLSLNASVYSLHDLKFPDTLMALAEAHGVKPECLTIEITESGLIKELSSALDILTRLRMKQINLSIDDFGMGYSMMQQLRNVPATELKVDKSFVQGIHESERDRTIVQKTIEIGHETGLMVIGEGVETAEQFDFLKRNHCDAVQGFLYSRPLPACEMRQWLGHYRRESLRA